ncbi:DUF2795 domain-containing protein [Quadrisphaera sp. DSM 44207]|uniref:DUF2795 domain-containing protein n=1 Tax=Quadrisphaera sp. DSM 44207 TaxID=1881057 RepID=UPI00088DBED2|nr:DUF2795 domain-containing protein [Quadrisphaera sp. DSM 44207]SDQ04108.1 Protein of unknown function [Quadrisphaera sp. DSM 44207]
MADQPSPIDLQKHLSGVEYPAGRDALVQHAEQQGAPQEVLERLRTIPDREYEGPSGVTHEVFNG